MRPTIQDVLAFELSCSGCPISHLVFAPLGILDAPVTARPGGTVLPRPHLGDRSQVILTPLFLVRKFVLHCSESWKIRSSLPLRVRISYLYLYSVCTRMYVSVMIRIGRGPGHPSARRHEVLCGT